MAVFPMKITIFVIIIFVLVLLFVSWHTQEAIGLADADNSPESESTNDDYPEAMNSDDDDDDDYSPIFEDGNSADANYCLAFANKGDTLEAKVIFAKKHNNLKIVLNVQNPIECEDYEKARDFTSVSYFINKSGRKKLGSLGIALGSELRTKSTSFSIACGRQLNKDGTFGPWSHEIKSYDAKPKKIKQKLQPVIQVDFPLNLGYIPTNKKPRKNEYFLQFENKIVEASSSVSVRCLPHFDTTYSVKFRAKITGECDSKMLADKELE